MKNDIDRCVGSFTGIEAQVQSTLEQCVGEYQPIVLSAGARLTRDVPFPIPFEAEAYCRSVNPEPTSAETYFNSLIGTMFTLLQIMTGDSWAEAVVRPVEDQLTGMSVAFVAFLAVASFALMNLVTAVIVDNALTISNEDKEQKVRQKKEKKKETVAKLRELFSDLDRDGSGTLTRDELLTSMEDDNIRNEFILLDIEESQAGELFDLLDVTEDNNVSADEFLAGISRVMDEPKAKDLLEIDVMVQRLRNKFDKFAGDLSVVPTEIAGIKEEIQLIQGLFTGRVAPAPPTLPTEGDNGQDGLAAPVDPTNKEQIREQLQHMRSENSRLRSVLANTGKLLLDCPILTS